MNDNLKYFFPKGFVPNFVENPWINVKKEDEEEAQDIEQCSQRVRNNKDCGSRLIYSKETKFCRCMNKDNKGGILRVPMDGYSEYRLVPS